MIVRGSSEWVGLTIDWRTFGAGRTDRTLDMVLSNGDDAGEGVSKEEVGGCQLCTEYAR